LDVDLSHPQLNKRDYKFGPLWRFVEHSIVFTQSGPFVERSIQCQKGAPILIAANPKGWRHCSKGGYLGG
jgi:hypothetical protein